MRIAFLGLGHMGLPMARNLLVPQHSLTVYNRTPGRAKALVTQGAKEATSVAEAVKDAEVAITMLSNDAAVKEVVQGSGGLLQHLPANAIHLCMGTIEVETSAALAAAHAKAGQGYVAAPVFGRAATAETRHIWIMAGGLEPQVNRCRPIFEALGQGYTRVGPHAAPAHALKLSGNMLSMAMELAVSEILIYAKKAGLPPADFLRFLNTAVFRSHMVDNYGEHTARPSFDPEDHTLDLAANELLLQQSRDMGVAIPVEDLLQVRLQAATARGWGEQDLAELTQACRSETGGKGAQGPDPAGPQLDPPRSVEAPPAQPESKKATPSKKPTPSKEKSKRLVLPIAEGAPPAQPEPSITIGATGSVPALSSHAFTAMEAGVSVTLDLNRTSHFELIDGQVWAWYQGQRYETSWRSFDEVELAFNHVIFLLIKRHLLLRPEAVLDFRSTFGGGARARVGDDLELHVSRTAASRLKELLGL